MSHINGFWMVGSLSFLFGILTQADARVVLNELMFRPMGDPIEDPAEEWIELFNAGSEPVNVAGWRLDRGVDYVISSDTVIEPGGFLILAADPAIFAGIYPDVTTTVLGGWGGKLSNSGEEVELEDSEGGQVDLLAYATQGDWAEREQGEKDGNGFRSWMWVNPANGEGHSLERTQPDLQSVSGKLWRSSLESRGTPGRENSVFSENVPPIVDLVSHHPVVPRVGEGVIVTARVVDEFDSLVSVSVNFRIDENGWSSASMTLNEEGLYEGEMGSFGDPFKVVEYYVMAEDASGQTRSWPPESTRRGDQDDSDLEHHTNALFLVTENDVQQAWNPGDPPRYYLIMPPTEMEGLDEAQKKSSGRDPVDAQFHGAFVSVDGSGVQVRQNISIRDRGFSSRSGKPVNYHVAIPNGERWNGRKTMQLNSRYTFSQALGAAMFQLAGLSTTEAVPVEVFMNGSNTADSGRLGYGRYVRAEPMNGDWVARLFPDDADGNLYRIDDHARLGTGKFTYEGEVVSEYDETYLKKTHEDLYDFSDIMAMTNVLENGPAEGYREALEEQVNVRQWLEYLVVNTLIANSEGGLGTGRADDFGIYRGVEDPRFVLLPHDLDSVMSIGDSPRPVDLFVYRNITGMNRMLAEDTRTIREYYQIYLEVMDDWFRSDVVDPVIDQLFEGWVPDEISEKAKEFVVDRRKEILSRIPTVYEAALLDTAGSTADGTPIAASETVGLSGKFHVGETGSILVNGRSAELSYGETGKGDPGNWSLEGFDLVPGVNTLQISYYASSNGGGEVVHSETLTAYLPETATRLAGTLEVPTDRGELQFVAPTHFTIGQPFPIRVDRLIEGSRWKSHAVEESVALSVTPRGVVFEPNQMILKGGQGVAWVTARLPDPPSSDEMEEEIDVLLGSDDVWWTFFDNREVPNDWKEENFNDRGWNQLSSPMGFPPAGNVDFVPPVRPTSYIRAEVDISLAEYVGLRIRMRYDDAVVLWVNGKKALTTPGLGDVVTSETRSTIDRPGIPTEFEEFSLSRELFVDGTNVLSFELHQSDQYEPADSFNSVTSDMILEAELQGVRGLAELPSMRLTAASGREKMDRVLLEEVDVRSVDGPAFGPGPDGVHQWGGAVEVTDSWTLPAGESLRIDPGTRIYVAPNVEVVINGSIDCQGLPEAPIRWASADPDQRWKGLRLKGSATFEHTLIHGAEVGLQHEGDVLEFTQSWIGAEKEALITSEAGQSIVVSDSVLEGGTAARVSSAEVVLERVTLVGDEVALETTSPMLQMVNSLVEGGEKGVVVLGGFASVEASLINGSRTVGLEISGGRASLSGTLMVNQKTAIHAVAGSLQADHITVAGELGFRIEEGVEMASVDSSILATTRVAEGAVDRFDGSRLLTRTVFGAHQVGDPLFVNPDQDDYRLQAGSPARATGADGEDLGALPFSDPDVIVGGTIRWRLVESPFHLVEDSEVPEGSVLEIDPGVNVYMDPGVRLTVKGVLRVLGTEDQRVRFSHHPDAAFEDDPLLPGNQPGSPKWGGVRLVDSLNSENVIQYADFVNAQPVDNQGSVGIIRSECLIDHCTFSGTHYRMVYGSNCSITVQHCVFPDMFAEDEDPVALRLDNVAEQLKVVSFPVPDDPRFVGGFPVGGHFRVYHNDFFGNKGHNDVFDADGGRWGESPVLDCRYNHFHGPVGDEHIDLGGDAYIAFNVFEDVRKDEFTSDRGYANAISTGDRGPGTSVVVVGNTFRNVDHAINCKVNTGTIFEHNTCLDFPKDYTYNVGAIRQEVRTSAVNLFVPDDFSPTPGDGAYLGYNVFYGSESSLFLPSAFPRLISWADLDRSGRPAKTSRVQIDHNLIDPDLEDPSIGDQHPGGVFDQRWGMGNQAGEPGTRRAANGLPFGAGIAEWAYIAGGPRNGSSASSATFVIGGPRIFAYRWRLNGEEWNSPIEIAPGEFLRDGPTVRTGALVLEELAPGAHRLEVLGQDFAGNWQPEDEATVREWVVTPEEWQDVILSEIRATGQDAVELFIRGEALDLAGWMLAESADDSAPYTFPSPSMIGAGEYLVVTEVSLDRDGDAIFLVNPDGRVIDEVRFGRQPSERTLGRVGEEWRLSEDTLGEANVGVVLGEPSALYIAEVLAAGGELFRDDWIELHNASSLPVALAGLRLTDNPQGDPEAHVFPAHTYLGGDERWVLTADGAVRDGHVDFSVSAEGEAITLADEQSSILDVVLVSPQVDGQSTVWERDGTVSSPQFPTDGFVATENEVERMLQLIDSIRVSEIHYNPIDGSDGEFVELTNIGNEAVDLEGLRFTRGINFVFPEWTLDPGAYVLVARDETVLLTRFPDAFFSIVGEYRGKLNNSGESITLTLPEPFGAAISDFRYEPLEADGVSIELVDGQMVPGRVHGSPADAASEDPDKEVRALLDYALGTAPRFSISASGFQIEMAEPRDDVRYAIESSIDLVEWETVSVRPAGGGWADDLVIEPLEGQRLRLVLGRDGDGGSVRYFRVSVTR